MTKATVTPKISGSLTLMSIQPENQIITQKDYPLANYQKIIKKCRNISA